MLSPALPLKTMGTVLLGWHTVCHHNAAPNWLSPVYPLMHTARWRLYRPLIPRFSRLPEYRSIHYVNQAQGQGCV